jgi:hypothetical protein
VRPLSTVALVFRSERLSVEEMTGLAGMHPDAAGRQDGPEGNAEHRSHAYWVVEGRDRYAALDAQIAEVLARVATFEAGLGALAAACDEAVFVAYEHSSGLVNAELAPAALALLARIGVSVHTT